MGLQGRFANPQDNLVLRSSAQRALDGQHTNFDFHIQKHILSLISHKFVSIIIYEISLKIVDCIILLLLSDACLYKHAVVIIS